jgi:hypothetical protein
MDPYEIGYVYVCQNEDFQNWLMIQKLGEISMKDEVKLYHSWTKWYNDLGNYQHRRNLLFELENIRIRYNSK